MDRAGFRHDVLIARHRSQHFYLQVCVVTDEEGYFFMVDLVVPAKVAPDVVATAFELAKKLRKTAVRAGVCDGFIGNRILAVYRQAADYMMEDGASPYQIDKAVREFGYPMGPYQMSDLAGGDIGWATRKRRAATRDPRARTSPKPIGGSGVTTSTINGVRNAFDLN